MSEQLGLPAAAVMTSEFVSAAELMARVLGADGYRFVTIEHPIASASPAELARRAATAASDCLALLSD
jgi:hypothetical protein